MIREVQLRVETDGVTVERFLRSRGLSRHLLTILKAVPDGMTVDGAHVRTVDRLRAGDVLALRVYEGAASGRIAPAALPLDIVYEDEDLFVINKPAGMAVHPSQGNREDTVANALAQLYAGRAETFVFRAVGRLDKNTSAAFACEERALRLFAGRAAGDLPGVPHRVRGETAGSGNHRRTHRPCARFRAAAGGALGWQTGGDALCPPLLPERLFPRARKAGNRQDPSNPGAFRAHRPPLAG